MESNLDSILSGEPESNEEVQTEQPAQAEQQGQETEEQQGTGEKEAGSPPEKQKDEPLDRHRKGLEAAALAERTKRQALERELQQLREQMQRPQPQPPQVQQQQQEEDPKPLRAHFETEDEWLDARDGWRDRQQAKAQQEAQAQRAQEELRTKVETVIAKAMAMEGFDLQAFSRVPVSDPMMEAILDSEVPEKLVHFLQANPEEATRIHALPNSRQIKELARIEDRLAEPEPEQPPVKERPQLPKTLTEARDSRGRFTKDAYEGPTPLNAILK
jgi:hypothetical protein